jgi:hypothetical protein
LRDYYGYPARSALREDRADWPFNIQIAKHSIKSIPSICDSVFEGAKSIGVSM